MSAVAYLSAGLVGAGIVLALSPGARPAGTTSRVASPPVPGAARALRRRTRSAVPHDGAARSRSLRGVAIVVTASLVGTGLVGGPLAGVVLGVGLVAGRAWLAHRARQRRVLAVATAIPELIDLFAIAASAGHPVRTCVELVAGRAPAPVRPALEGACARVGRGVALGAALTEAGEQLGPAGSPLVEALVAGLATGAPLGPALGRASDAARDERRRRAEEAARRLPVTLLFPLVCCVLPAFGLLAVVPLLAASLASLHT